MLDVAKEHNSKECIKILKTFYHIKHAQSKSNSTCKTVELDDTTLNLSSISTISSIKPDTETSSPVLPPPPAHPPLPAIPRSTTLKKAHSHDVKPQVATSSGRSRSKSKTREVKARSNSKTRTPNVLTNAGELETMISDLIDLKLGLKQSNTSAVSLNNTPRTPEKRQVRCESTSTSTQTKIDHKRFYSPEKLPVFYKTSLSQLKAENMNANTNTNTNTNNSSSFSSKLPPQSPPVVSSLSLASSLAPKLSGNVSVDTNSKETQTTGKMVRLKPQTPGKSDFEPSSVSVDVLNELNSKFNNEMRTKSSSVDARWETNEYFNTAFCDIRVTN